MAQLAEHLCFLMDVAARKITKFYNQRLRRFGITYNHLFTLTCLWEQDGMNVKDLSKQLILDSSSLTGYLDRIETRGLVHRQDDPEDRRGVRVFLTAQGWSLKNQLEPIGRELKHTLEQGVPHGKVEAFAQALRHIHDRLG
jgi:MarR family transcriptional regulator, organic hydroperoxide resistance regulator